MVTGSGVERGSCVRHGGFAQAARAPCREMQTVGAERHCSARSRRVSCAQRVAAQPRELLDAHPDLPGLRTWAPFTGHQPRDRHVPVRVYHHLGFRRGTRGLGRLAHVVTGRSQSRCIWHARGRGAQRALRHAPGSGHSRGSTPQALTRRLPTWLALPSLVLPAPRPIRP